MKNIFKHFGLFLVAGLISVSCDYDETNYDSLINEVDPGANYYVQFQNASQSLQTGFDEMANIVDIETTIDVVLLGTPRSEDVVVDLTVDPASTVETDMYELSNSSVIIPAGETSGSVSLRTNTENMPEGETLTLIMNIDAGEHNATAGTTLRYDLQRIEYCPLTLEDFVGTWSGRDSWDYSTQVTTFIEDGTLYMNGVGFGWFQDWWGEVIVTNEPVPVDVDLITGQITIDESKQTDPYLTSTWDGAPQPAYNLTGSGRMTDTCDRILELNYAFIQSGGEIDGTAYGPAFQEVITLGPIENEEEEGEDSLEE